ncbi:hypothetical protein [Rhodobacter sp. NSM]|uniref:hypothetical protein n=1 Tax=Rhodobacter sp. NSM TaxID=3457501 RepID=UPI003FD4E2C6
MNASSQTGPSLLRPDRRTGPDFSDAILCEAACQAIVDSLRGEGPLACGGRDPREN